MCIPNGIIGCAPIGRAGAASSNRRRVPSGARLRTRKSRLLLIACAVSSSCCARSEAGRAAGKAETNWIWKRSSIPSPTGAVGACRASACTGSGKTDSAISRWWSCWMLHVPLRPGSEAGGSSRSRGSRWRSWQRPSSRLATTSRCTGSRATVATRVRCHRLKGFEERYAGDALRRLHALDPGTTLEWGQWCGMQAECCRHAVMPES